MQKEKASMEQRNVPKKRKDPDGDVGDTYKALVNEDEISGVCSVCSLILACS